MRLFYLLILFTFLFYSQTVFAVFPPTNCNITTVLRVGSKGAQVECLQKSLNLSLGFGLSTDGIFGPLTKAAVMVFQSSHKLAADGIVGPLSRATLEGVVTSVGTYPAGCTGATGYSTTTGAKCDSGSNPLVINNGVVAITPEVQFPKVFSISPEKARSGDTVKIYGENFSLTGNTVRLRYGQIEDRFENLASSDGKFISFVYQPPEVETMSKEELLNLPSNILNKILDPLKAAGGSIDDLVAPYRNMRNEDDLRQFLSNNGHNFDELYDKFWVTIENANGRGSSSGPILAGLRKLSFGSNLSILENKFFSPIIRSLFEIFAPKKAYAQLPEGGTNSGIIMECTCGDGYLTWMEDFSTNGGSDLYWWSSGFVPIVGDPEIPGPQLGFFIQDAGQCVMDAGPSCFDITANIASLPWGEAPL